jgi:hypothetical protein
MAVRLGLDMAQGARKVDPQKLAAAIRLHYLLSGDDKDRIEVLHRAARLAQLPALEGPFPSNEADWLVASAHNAACDAEGLRQKDWAREYMEAAVAIAQGTGSKMINKSECLRMC